ncbi:MAG TPA: nucleoside transporter C-terminal domain-containing protein [Planctomycetota bacterium]|nr:nucleoside transporter C-terminal domain-containing protein [Planctomycetota bacterium]
MQIIRGLLGIGTLLGLCYLLSWNRRAIRLRPVVVGLLLQVLLGLLIFKTRAGEAFFQELAAFTLRFFEFSYRGSEFVFGPLGKPSEGGVFYLAFQALPILIYFSAVMAVLYHLGVMQVVVYAFSRIMGRLLGVSGAESMAVTGEILVGMTESPLLVRPYIERMTRSELVALMTGGFATIAGTVMGIYMGFVGEQYAPFLLAGSVMAAPATFVAAKIVLPETEVPVTGKEFHLRVERQGANLLDAIAIGVRDGLGLALNIAAMLIAFYSLIALLNWPLEAWLATSIQGIFGVLLSPLAWCIGVDWSDAANFGRLLGTKIALNEWIAYDDLKQMIQRGELSERSITLATFALCGFANFGSIGVTLGGIGQLAPGRRQDLARLAFRSMLAGAIASCMTAAVAGMVL